MDWLQTAINGASSVLNWFSQRDTNNLNKQLTREQMAFQERMSNTAVQRHAKDLEAAGFNRLLAAGANGASTPTGAAATMRAPEITPIDIIGIQKARADVSKTKAETSVANETARNLTEQNKNLAAQNVLLRRQAEKILVENGMTKVQARKVTAEAMDKEYELGGKIRGGSYDADGQLLRSIKSTLRMLRDGDVTHREEFYPMSRIPEELRY